MSCKLPKPLNGWEIDFYKSSLNEFEIKENKLRPDNKPFNLTSITKGVIHQIVFFVQSSYNICFK